MRKIIDRFILWNEWQKNCLNNPIYKFMVLLGVCYSPTFSAFKSIKDFQLSHPDLTIRFHDGEMKNDIQTNRTIKLTDLEKELP